MFLCLPRSQVALFWYSRTSNCFSQYPGAVFPLRIRSTNSSALPSTSFLPLLYGSDLYVMVGGCSSTPATPLSPPPPPPLHCSSACCALSSCAFAVSSSRVASIHLAFSLISCEACLLTRLCQDFAKRLYWDSFLAHSAGPLA